MSGENKEGALKFDTGKVPLDLIPRSALMGLGEVLQMGAEKYGRHNYRKGMEWSRLVAAALRHLSSWNEGESLDPESGKSHLKHAMCCLAFLVEYEEKGIGTDDRYKRQ